MKLISAFYNRFEKYIPLFQWTFTAFYFSLFIYIVFLARRRRHMPERLTNFKPFTGMVERYKYLWNEPAWKTVDFYENLYGNILLFIPLPIILLVLFRIKSRWVAMIISVAVSVGIEIVQYALTIGVADSDDLFLNSAGAAIGIGLYAVWQRFVLKKIDKNSSGLR